MALYFDIEDSMRLESFFYPQVPLWPRRVCGRASTRLQLTRVCHLVCGVRAWARSSRLQTDEDCFWRVELTLMQEPHSRWACPRTRPRPHPRPRPCPRPCWRPRAGQTNAADEDTFYHTKICSAGFLPVWILHV